ncbi:MAG: hypothetical protein IKU15_07405 [Clostridia bacterium]|nr:hypothetical protein [Clostridia bacterium]
MISKCENVVINRVKFSEFEGYDPSAESTDGLKLVGYIETDAGKRNISVDYGKLLKKNGEIPARGTIIYAEAIPSSSIISNNIVCEQVAGFKIDANDLEFIQINGLNEKNYIHNGFLSISFASASYAVGQECALFLHNIPANICVYTPVLSADNPIYDETLTESLAGKFVSLLIIFTAVQHSAYGHVMLPTRAFVADGNKSFHAYAPTIIKEEELSPIARMLPASNANLDMVAMRVSDLEARALETITSFETLNNKIDNEISETNATITSEINAVKDEIENVATVSSEAIETLHELLEDKIDEVTDSIEKAAAETANDLSKILHVVKFESKDELNRWISELESATKVKELSRTIALIRQENDTYEEYVCVNPDQADGNPLEWDRLGAVDSIYATHETMGSVQLVHDVTEGTIDTYIDTNIAGDIYPKKGLAVAPIALKDLYNKHNANVSSINDALVAIEETKNAVEVINKELEIKTNTDESTSSRIDTVDATIEHIKDIIGLNGCHSSCSCDTHKCEDLTNKCTILCRVDENERDISNISESLGREITRLDKVIVENVNTINTTISDIAETVGTYTDEKIAEAAALIAQNNAHIAENDAKIADIQANYVHNDALAELVDIIGLNGCHKNESCSTHHCEDVSGKCTILCRIGENERDISALSENVITINKGMLDLNDAVQTADETFKTQLAATAEYVDGKFEEVQSKFTVCEDELSRLSDTTSTNKENIAELNAETRRIAAEVTRLETSELVALKDADTAFETELSRLDSDINKQITSISAIEAGIADVRSIVESNAATNTADHSNIITRLTKLESDYTSDKTYKEIAQTNMVYGTQAYNEVVLLKSVVEDIKSNLRTVATSVENIDKRVITLENLVNDCNEKSGFAITTASNAAEKANAAIDTANQAVKDAATAIQTSTESFRTATEAKDTAEHVVAEVEDLIKKNQSLHSTLFSFKSGAADGVFTIDCAKDFTEFDSVYYNFAIVETRSNGEVVYPSVEFAGAINSDKAEGRTITVSTGRVNEATLITVLAYRAEQHVIEK